MTSYFELVKDSTALVTIYPLTECLEVLVHDRGEFLCYQHVTMVYLVIAVVIFWLLTFMFATFIKENSYSWEKHSFK